MELLLQTDLCKDDMKILISFLVTFGKFNNLNVLTKYFPFNMVIIPTVSPHIDSVGKCDFLVIKRRWNHTSSYPRYKMTSYMP